MAIFKAPLLDLVYGKYITVLFDTKRNDPALPHRRILFLKERNQFGKPTLVSDVPEGALVPIAPAHELIPHGLYAWVSAAGGIHPVADQLRIKVAEAYEKMAEALTQKDASDASKKAQERLMARSVEQQVDDVLRTTEKVQDAGSKYFSLPNRFERDKDALMGGRG